MEIRTSFAIGTSVLIESSLGSSLPPIWLAFIPINGSEFFYSKCSNVFTGEEVRHGWMQSNGNNRTLSLPKR